MTPSERELIQQFKHQLGPIIHLDYSGDDSAQAHHRLGQNARAQIHKILSGRLDALGETAQVIGQIRRACKYRAALQTKSQLPGLDETVKTALRQYSACLSAWAAGAQLADFRHPLLPDNVDQFSVSANDLATFLQEDEVGCQTGVIRERDGAVILWHTEEDLETCPGQRFDQLRLFSFRAAQGRISTGFIYPDLLPGPTFGWQGRDYVQAIDTLHVKPVDFEYAILPNTLAWLSLYLGTSFSREKLAKLLGPFQGGYSLTSVAQKDGQVSVEKIEYAGDQVAASSLAAEAGGYLFQTNVIRDLSLPIGAQEQTSAESRAWNETRMARTARFMKAIQKSVTALPLIFRMLYSHSGGESAYCNHDVKAYLVCRMATERTSIRVGSGAPAPDDELFTYEE